MFTISSEEFRNKWGENIERVLSGAVLTIPRYSHPALVMMPHAQYQAMNEELAELRRFKVATLIHKRASEIMECNNATGSWISQEELVARLEKTHGPEYITAITEGLTEHVAG